MLNFQNFLQVLIATAFEPQVLRDLLGLFSEACLIISQILPASKRVKFLTHRVLKLILLLLLSTIKDLGTSKSNQTIRYT